MPACLFICSPFAKFRV